MNMFLHLSQVILLAIQGSMVDNIQANTKATKKMQDHFPLYQKFCASDDLETTTTCLTSEVPDWAGNALTAPLIVKSQGVDRAEGQITQTS